MRHVESMGENRNVYKILARKPEEERRLRRLGRLGHWINMAQNTDKWRAVLNALMNLRIP